MLPENIRVTSPSRHPKERVGAQFRDPVASQPVQRPPLMYVQPAVNAAPVAHALDAKGTLRPLPLRIPKRPQHLTHLPVLAVQVGKRAGLGQVEVAALVEHVLVHLDGDDLADEQVVGTERDRLV